MNAAFSGSHMPPSTGGGRVLRGSDRGVDYSAVRSYIGVTERCSVACGKSVT